MSSYPNNNNTDNKQKRSCMVTIKLYATRLKNVAGVGKGISDPYAVVTQLASTPTDKPRVLGKTEVIKNTLNPAWTTQFHNVEYEFGVETRININIFDEVRKTGKHIPMGSAGFEIGEILGSRGNVKAKKLKLGGVLFVRVTKSLDEGQNLGNLHVQFKGIQLQTTPGAKSKLLRTFQPNGFYILSAVTISGGIGGSGNRVWHPVYRSEVIKKETSPCWKSFDIPIEKLCMGDQNKAIQIEIYDWKKNGKHTLLGKCQTSLSGILQNAQSTAERERHHHQQQQQKLTAGSGVATDNNNNNNNDDDDGISTTTTVPGRLILSHQGKEGGFIEIRRANIIGGSGGPLLAVNGGGSQVDSSSTNVVNGHGNNNNNNMSTASLPPPITPTITAAAAAAVATGPLSSSLPPSMPPKVPSMSSYPISMTESASDLPPPIPPPAFDESSGPVHDPNHDTDMNALSTGISAMMPPPPTSSSLASSLASSTSSIQPPPASSLPGPSSSPSSKYPRQQPQRHRPPPEFVDYLSGGLEINLQFAIDFTGSNGDPRKPGTLHYIHPNGKTLNDYEKALTGVGSIIARYDNDKHFPVYGFGAKYGGQIKHIFQVGGAKELKGIKGVLEGYRSVFSTGLTMSNPTVFAEVIQYAAIQAQKKFQQHIELGKQTYSILLIITDGAVTDIDQTIGAINYASSAPLSIVIVGVGNADFSNMNLLDKIHEKYPGTRDIVKFVEFSKFRNNRQALTKETLDEIPSQVVEYFVKKGIMPNPEITAAGSPSSSSLFSERYADEYDANEDLDLSLTVLEDGSVQLDNSKQAMWNAQAYGTASGFLQSGAMRRPSAPSMSASYHQPTTGSQQQSQPPSSSSNPYMMTSSYTTNPPSGVYNPSNAHPQLSPKRNMRPYV